MFQSIPLIERLGDLIERAKTAVARQSLLFVNASYLAIGPAVSSLLGFAFWLIAGRYATPEAQGLAAAAVSAMMLTAFISEAGLHTFLIGHVARHQDRATATAGIVASVSLAALLAILFVLLSGHVAPTLSGLVRTWSTGALFVFGAVVTAFSVTLDGVLLGLFAGKLRMWREIICASLRVGCLVAALLLCVFTRQDLAILVAWAGAAFGSVAFALVAAARWNIRLWERPDFVTLARLSPQVVSHHLLNLATVGPAIAFPVLVAEVLSPAINAVFYIAWMLLQAILLVPAGFGTALYPVGASQPDRIAAGIKMSVTVCVAVGLAAGFAFYVLLEPILWLINPVFSEISGQWLCLIGFSAIAVTVKHHYIAIMRLKKRMSVAAAVLAVMSFFELAFAAVAGQRYGLDGLTLAWLAAVVLQAIILLPVVLRATSEDFWCAHRAQDDAPDVPAAALAQEA